MTNSAIPYSQARHICCWHSYTWQPMVQECLYSNLQHFLHTEIHTVMPGHSSGTGWDVIWRHGAAIKQPPWGRAQKLYAPQLRVCLWPRGAKWAFLETLQQGRNYRMRNLCLFLAVTLAWSEFLELCLHAGCTLLLAVTAHVCPSHNR